MKNLTTLQNHSVKTYRDMYNAMYPVQGSFSRGKQTVTRQFRLSGETVTIYHHWSTEGFRVYTNDSLINPIAEVVFGEWYPWMDDKNSDPEGDDEIACYLPGCVGFQHYPVYDSGSACQTIYEKYYSQINRSK